MWTTRLSSIGPRGRYGTHMIPATTTDLVWWRKRRGRRRSMRARARLTMHTTLYDEMDGGSQTQTKPNAIVIPQTPAASFLKRNGIYRLKG